MCSLRTICGGLFDRGDGYDPAELHPVFVNRDEVVRSIIEDPSDPSYSLRDMDAWRIDFERRLAEQRSAPRRPPGGAEMPPPEMRAPDAPTVGQVTDRGQRLYQAKRKSEARKAAEAGVQLEHGRGSGDT